MLTAVLNKKRLRREYVRHPWVYSNSVQSISRDNEALDPNSLAPGEIVRVVAPDGRFVGWAFANPASRLFLRLFSFIEAESDPATLFPARLHRAIELRRDVLKLGEVTEAYRLVHSEADGLPGMIVDVYGKVAVLTVSCRGTHEVLDELVKVLVSELEIATVIERGKAKGIRGQEGLGDGRGVIYGELKSERAVLTIHGIQHIVEFSDGQKTGLFLDQRDNFTEFAALCSGHEVLDACCYTASFGLAALAAGAKSVVAFDASKKAIAHAQENARTNGFADQFHAEVGDLFDKFREYREAGRTFSRIVFDPPKFAKRRADQRKAMKAYTQAHSLLLKILEPGGVFTTYSCSHHFDDKALEESLREAARRSQRTVQIIRRLGPGADHPQDVDCGEGRYLYGFICRCID